VPAQGAPSRRHRNRSRLSVRYYPVGESPAPKPTDPDGAWVGDITVMSNVPDLGDRTPSTPLVHVVILDMGVAHGAADPIPVLTIAAAASTLPDRPWPDAMARLITGAISSTIGPRRAPTVRTTTQWRDVVGLLACCLVVDSTIDDLRAHVTKGVHEVRELAANDRATALATWVRDGAPTTAIGMSGIMTPRGAR
jgi:hypothetical protein